MHTVGFGPRASKKAYLVLEDEIGVSVRLTRCRALMDEKDSGLRVYSTGDLPDVYEDSFMAVANPDGRGFQPTLILVCTRLGIDKINQVYEEALISTLQLPQSIGIAG